MTAILVKMAEHAPRLDPMSSSARVLTDSLDNDAHKVLGNEFLLKLSRGDLTLLLSFLFHRVRKRRLKETIILVKRSSSISIKCHQLKWVMAMVKFR